MTSRPLTLDDCESIVRRLWPYLDGKLPESDRAIITRHLEGCTHCRSHYDFARAFLDAVHAVRPSEATNDVLRARVLSALREEGFAADG